MQNKQHRPSTQETQIAFSILASRNPFPMSFQPEKIRTLFSPSAHVQTAPFAPVPFPLSVNSVDSCKKIQGPSTLNSQRSTILECYAWEVTCCTWKTQRTP